ncbi:MAG: nuclear transport factor 2 family protein [Caldilineaceae bacterium]
MKRDEIEALVQRQADAWQCGDVEAIVADFDETALFISPGGVWRGRAAIRQAATAFWSTVQSVNIQVVRMLIDGDHGAVEWIWTEVRCADGQSHSAADAIIFTLTKDKISYWREYFDSANF